MARAPARASTKKTIEQCPEQQRFAAVEGAARDDESTSQPRAQSPQRRYLK